MIYVIGMMQVLLKYSLKQYINATVTPHTVHNIATMQQSLRTQYTTLQHSLRTQYTTMQQSLRTHYTTLQQCNSHSAHSIQHFNNVTVTPHTVYNIATMQQSLRTQYTTHRDKIHMGSKIQFDVCVHGTDTIYGCAMVI